MLSWNAGNPDATIYLFAGDDTQDWEVRPKWAEIESIANNVAEAIKHKDPLDSDRLNAAAKELYELFKHHRNQPY